MAKIYTGVEFSNTPENIRSLMSRIAAQLKNEGWILRTNVVGCFAEGGIKRSAFAAGINMPLVGFYEKATKNSIGEVFIEIDPLSQDYVDLMYQDILEVFPDLFDRLWSDDKCDKFYDTVGTGLKLLGYSYNEPSDCLICYAPDETDEEVLPMLYLAKKYCIPVINLAHKANLDRILYWLGA